MNSHSKILQEMSVHLCRQLREAFGASYCRIAILPETAKIAANGVEHEATAEAPETEAGVTLIHMDGNSNDYLALARQNGNEAEEAGESGPQLVATIVSACRQPQPVLRFYLQQSSDTAPQTTLAAYLDLAFASPRHFSASEVMAMMLMVEMTKAVLAAWNRTTPALTAEQVVGKLQNNLFALPFLEAKKQWIDAFEEEYLRQQLMKYYGNISKAARAARISRYTLYALLNKFQFSARAFKKSKVSRSAAKASLNAAVAANVAADTDTANEGTPVTQAV